ncbi:MAG TPA: hypothetical protein VK458_28185, partial [Myxococcaceae bacterium]|nr:hypothetical protein [Myxococcaceae bacterium]
QGSTLENTWQLWQRERAALYEQPGRSDRQSSLAASLEVSIKGPRMTEGARRLLSWPSCLEVWRRRTWTDFYQAWATEPRRCSPRSGSPPSNRSACECWHPFASTCSARGLQARKIANA